jgi:type I restriction enzyme R subunit
MVCAGPEEGGPTLPPRSPGAGRSPRDREKEYLSELLDRLNALVGIDTSNTSKVVFLIDTVETIRTTSPNLVAQVQNNTREQALKGDLPAEALRAAAKAMATKNEFAKTMLKESAADRRMPAFELIYELLLSPDLGNRLLEAARDQ